MLVSLRSALRVAPAARRALSAAAAVQPSAKSDDLYRGSAQAFFNFPVEQIEFRVGEHFLHPGEPHPMLYFADNTEPGLLHLAPPAPAIYCWFGERGNMGKKRMFLPNQPEITDPWEAEQEVSIKITSPLAQEYVEWLEEIQNKFVDHLLANTHTYKKLKKFEGKNPDILRDMAVPLVKYSKDDDEKPIEGTGYLSWRQRMYNKSERQPNVRCSLDTEMAQQGGVRRHIPMYTLTGAEVPLSDIRIYPNDIISVQNNIMCGLWGIGNAVGFKLRRNLRSVTLMEEAQREQPTAPLTNAPLGCN